MLESWMINFGLILLGGAATYGALRTRLIGVENDFKEHKKSDDTYHADMSRKQDAQFKRIDTTINRITIVEQKISKFLDLEEAEKKFVSKRELELHLKNIELTTKNTSHQVDKIEGKLEELVALLSNGAIK